MRPRAGTSLWPRLLLLVATLAIVCPLVALYALPSLLSRSSAVARRETRLDPPATATTLESVAHGLSLQQPELEDVSHALGVLDSLRRAMAALPAIANSTRSVAASLGALQTDVATMSARLDVALVSIGRMKLQIKALSEPWTGHAGEIRCAAGHRCASYIDAGQSNLSALASVAACADYCKYAFGTNFFAFHNEVGWIAFMLEPKGRCRCHDNTPCELVPDGAPAHHRHLTHGAPGLDS
jgi:hypothetical protein